MRILYVEDNFENKLFVRRVIESMGHEMLEAETGLDSLTIAAQEMPDLILMDINIPGMDGLETLKQIRAFSPVPVIILSARGANTDKIAGLELGADDYLAKPFSPDELVARIEAIRRRLLPDENRRVHEQRLSLDNS